MSSPSNPSVSLYGVGVGTASSAQFPSSPVVQNKDPASSDIQGQFGQYPVGQQWINSSTGAVFSLTGFSASNGIISATWVALASSATQVATLTGNTGGAVSPTAGNINVVGSGAISVAGNPGTSTLTISSSAGGIAYSDVSGTVTASVNSGYFVTNTCTSTLPASPAEGDTVIYLVDTTNILTITANSGQKIRIGSALSATAGTAANNARGDAVTLIYRATGTTWIAKDVIGTFTVT